MKAYKLILLISLIFAMTNTCAAIAPLATPISSPEVISSSIAVSNISDASSVAKYDKQEITFSVTTLASNPQLPFDSSAPNGIDGNAGVSVDGIFTSPMGKVWVQPAFYYQIFDDQIKGGEEWFYPTGQAVWKVRFSPDEVGTWHYYIKVQDKSGVTQTTSHSFAVIASTNRGFIRASKTDPRYFEYSDGTYFPALGMNAAYNEIQWTNPNANQDYFQKTGSNGIQVIRTWLTYWSIFGSTWNPWYSIRNDYDGYLPRAGLLTNGIFSMPVSQMQLVYENNNSYWFDACRFIGGFQAAPAVKQNTKYHIKIRYKAQGINGPRNSAYPGFGLVAKVQNPNDGNWHTNCYDGGDPQNGVKVTGYGKDSLDWTYLEGEWDSGIRNTLPVFYLALENVNNLSATVNGLPWIWHPEVGIDTIYIGEDLGGGNYGPNIVTKPSMEHLSYYMERNAYAFDKVLDLAKQNGVYLKLVVMEKDEQIENEIGFNGNAASFNNNNFYGNYRTITVVRWYQQAWWRYLQARWGYSPNIFAFEAVNEAAPGNTNHYGQVDEMGKYLHCRVFGVSVLPGDGQKCDLLHPNAHMVSTSFWSGFESGLFASNKYPNVDYADIHQYIAKDADLTHFQDTALSTYDLGLAYGALRSGSGKPIMRGETGLTNQASNAGSLTDVSADTKGIWLHNLIWGGINPTGLIESYWYAKDHIYKTVDLRGQFKNYYTFIKDIPLNNGKYVDASAVVSNSKLRAWGQKDLTNQRAHLWIANTDHVWTNTGSIAPEDGTVTISGFTPNTSFQVEWWDTYAGLVVSQQAISTKPSGELTLTVSNISTDLAVKIIPQPSGSDQDTTGVFRPSNGLLYLKNSNVSGLADVTLNYGLPGDYPVVGDWDGDGDATIGIYRNGTFYLKNDNTIGFADILFQFGSSGDQPIAGDWNGDGVDTIGVYRNGTFYLRNSNSSGAPELSFGLGNPGDVGIAGDWNGDGIDSTGVFRPSNGVIYLKNLNTTGFADIALNYGLPGDQPVMGDWNNDGIDTIGIYRNGTFYLRNENTIGFAELIFALGNPGDMPIAGNWDASPPPLD